MHVRRAPYIVQLLFFPASFIVFLVMLLIRHRLMGYHLKRTSSRITPIYSLVVVSPPRSSPGPGSRSVRRGWTGGQVVRRRAPGPCRHFPSYSYAGHRTAHSWPQMTQRITSYKLAAASAYLTPLTLIPKREIRDLKCIRAVLAEVQTSVLPCLYGRF